MMENNMIEQYKKGNRISDDTDEADENRIWDGRRQDENRFGGKSDTRVSRTCLIVLHIL